MSFLTKQAGIEKSLCLLIDYTDFRLFNLKILSLYFFSSFTHAGINGSHMRHTL